MCISCIPVSESIAPEHMELEYHYGKQVKVSTNRRDNQELNLLCLHLLQASMVCSNTPVTTVVLFGLEHTFILTGMMAGAMFNLMEP